MILHSTPLMLRVMRVVNTYVQDYIWTVPGENSLETPRGKM